MKTSKPKLFYDANFSINEHRGMGKYINSFVKILKDEYEIIGMLKKNDANLPLYKSFGFSNYILWEQISLLRFFNRNRGIFIFPYNTAPLFINKNNFKILILHDLIFLNKGENLTFKQKVGKFYRAFLVKRIIRNFENIITVSEYSKNEIVKKLNINPNKISVIYNSIKLDEVIQDTNLERQKFFFHIGGEPRYKNTKSLLYAFALLPEEIKKTYFLKILGIRNPKTLKTFQQILKDLGIDQQVIFLNYKTDQEVEQLYKEATLFLFPSLEEGFGIPLIEAMKFGCPLVSSNYSCLPEISGNAATYFDPNNYESIVIAIMNVINNPELRLDKIKEGYLQVKKFSNQSFENSVKKWFLSNYIEKTK